jgi:hypothetical protein
MLVAIFFVQTSSEQISIYFQFGTTARETYKFLESIYGN